MIIYYAILDFGTRPPQSRFDSLLGTFLTFLIIIAFLRPLVMFIHKLLRIPQAENLLPKGKWFLRILAVSLVSTTGVLQNVLKEEIRTNPLGFGTLLLTVFIFAGSITYSWTIGVNRRLFRAKWQGAVCGFFLGGLILVLLCLLFPEQNFCQLSPEGFIGGIIVNGLIWGFLGFAGGLAVDLGYGARPVIIVLFLLAASLISSLPLFYMHFVQDPDLPLHRPPYGVEDGHTPGLLGYCQSAGLGLWPVGGPKC